MTPAPQIALARSAFRQEGQGAAPLTFRAFLLSPDYCGPYWGPVTPSPALLAVVDASEGRAPSGLSPADVEAIFRRPAHGLATQRPPRVVVVNAGRRGGKTSNLLAPKMVHAAWTTPLPDLKPGEIARAVVISPDLDLSEAAFNYAVGICESSPVLRRAVVKKNTEQIVLRRPDGKLCEIVTGAASRGGAAARSRTCVFVGLDEAAFFYAADGHTVNDRDIYNAALGTLKFVAGSQCWIVSTPWVEEEGLMEELIRDYWGPAGAEAGVVVAARISSYALRGMVDDGSLREGLDEDTYRREILSVPLPRGTRGYFPADLVAAALARCAPAGAPEADVAGADLGHADGRDNSAVALERRYPGGIFSVFEVDEVMSTSAQKPSDTYHRFGRRLAYHGLTEVVADPMYKETFKEVLDAYGVTFIDVASKDRTYEGARALLREGRLCMGDLPAATRESLTRQFRSIVAKPLAGGRVAITATRDSAAALARGLSSGKGHADAVSAIIAGLWRIGSCDPSLWGVAVGRDRGAAGGEVRYAPGEDPLRGAAFDWAAERAGGDGDGWESSGGGSQWG